MFVLQVLIFKYGFCAPVVDLQVLTFKYSVCTPGVDLQLQCVLQVLTSMY